MLSLTLILEVMDKEVGVPTMWVLAALIGVGGFVACRRRPWAALLLLPLVALSARFQYEEINDPYVGPAILREAGAAYPLHSYASHAVAAALILAGCVVWLTRRAKLRQA